MSGNKYKQQQHQVCKLLKKSRGESYQYDLVENLIPLPKAALPTLPTPSPCIFSVLFMFVLGMLQLFFAAPEGERERDESKRTDCAANKSDF